jgi:hypothetical protein
MIVARCEMCSGYVAGCNASNATYTKGARFEYPSRKPRDTQRLRRGWNSGIYSHRKIQYRQSLLRTE